MSEETPDRPNPTRTRTRDASRRSDAAGVDVSSDVEAGLAPDPDPEDVVDAGPVLRARRADPSAGPHVLVWNHAKGVRIAPYREALRDASGAEILDLAGHVQWAAKVSVVLVPGLNLVPAEQWGKVRRNAESMIASGELQSLGGDIAAIRPARLMRAIQETAIETPLRWIAERESRADVLEVVEAQIRDVVSSPGRVSMRTSHGARAVPL